MSNINENNLIPVNPADLKTGQRLEKHTASDGSVFYVVQGVGSFVAGGKVFVEAQTTIVDDTSTEPVIDILKANRRYVFTQPITSLFVGAVENSTLESDIEFTVGDTDANVRFPASLKMVNSTAFKRNESYIISIKNNRAVMAGYAAGEQE
jgi:hypothetical protein